MEVMIQVMIQAMITEMIKVMRDGEEIVVNSTEVVRGDVVVLATGDIVPADCRLITADELKVNEMCLTGEADDVNKTADVPTHLLHRAGDAISPNTAGTTLR